MSTCAICGAETEESALVYAEEGMICPTCDVDKQGEKLDTGMLHPAALVGLVVAVIPFFLKLDGAGWTGGAYPNFDPVAVAGGGVAALAGLGAVNDAVKSTKNKGAKLGIAAVVIGLGIYHMLRGFGYI